MTRGNYFLFDSVFIYIKKVIKLIFKKKNQNRFKPTSFGSVRFVFRTKTDSNRFGSVFSVRLGFGSVFSSLGSVFSVSGL